MQKGGCRQQAEGVKNNKGRKLGLKTCRHVGLKNKPNRSGVNRTGSVTDINRGEAGFFLTSPLPLSLFTLLTKRYVLSILSVFFSGEKVRGSDDSWPAGAAAPPRWNPKFIFLVFFRLFSFSPSPLPDFKPEILKTKVSNARTKKIEKNHLLVLCLWIRSWTCFGSIVAWVARLCLWLAVHVQFWIGLHDLMTFLMPMVCTDLCWGMFVSILVDWCMVVCDRLRGGYGFVTVVRVCCACGSVLLFWCLALCIESFCRFLWLWISAPLLCVYRLVFIVTCFWG